MPDKLLELSETLLMLPERVIGIRQRTFKGHYLPDIHASDKQRHYRTRKYAQGYADYDDYLAWLDRIFGEVLRVTRPGGFCAIVIGTVLLNGRHYPVPFDLIARLSRSGWEFHQDVVWHKCTAGVKRAGASAVVLASSEGNNPVYIGVEAVLQNKLTDVRVFGKPTTRPYRRMAVVLTYDKPGADVNKIKENAIALAKNIKVSSN